MCGTWLRGVARLNLAVLRNFVLCRYLCCRVVSLGGEFGMKSQGRHKQPSTSA